MNIVIVRSGVPGIVCLGLGYYGYNSYAYKGSNDIHIIACIWN